jgi:hypothetical protein
LFKAQRQYFPAGYKFPPCRLSRRVVTSPYHLLLGVKTPLCYLELSVASLRINYNGESLLTAVFELIIDSVYALETRWVLPSVCG